MLTKPKGPIFGAKEEVAPTSPPTHRKYTENRIKNQQNNNTQCDEHITRIANTILYIPYLTSVGSNLGGMIYFTFRYVSYKKGRTNADEYRFLFYIQNTQNQQWLEIRRKEICV